MLTSDVPQNYISSKSAIEKWRSAVIYKLTRCDRAWHVPQTTVTMETIHRLTSDVPQSYTKVDKWCTTELYTGCEVIVLKSYTQVDKWCTTELYIVWQVMYYRAIHKLTSDVPQNYTEVDQWSTPELYTGWQVMYYRAIHRLTSDVLHSYTQAIHKLTCDVPQNYIQVMYYSNYTQVEWCTTELYTGWQVMYLYTELYHSAVHKLTNDVPSDVNRQ